MSYLSKSKAISILQRFDADWANLRDKMTNNVTDDDMVEALNCLCSVRRKLCRDKRVLKWYLQAGLKTVELFCPATTACIEWEDKPAREINAERFKDYNNWTLTTTTRWMLIQAANGTAYDDWNFKHPLPPTYAELLEILDGDTCPAKIRIGGVLHDLDWYCCA